MLDGDRGEVHILEFKSSRIILYVYCSEVISREVVGMIASVLVYDQNHDGSRIQVACNIRNIIYIDISYVVRRHGMVIDAKDCR